MYVLHFNFAVWLPIFCPTFLMCSFPFPMAFGVYLMPLSLSQSSKVVLLFLLNSRNLFSPFNSVCHNFVCLALLFPNLTSPWSSMIAREQKTQNTDKTQNTFSRTDKLDPEWASISLCILLLYFLLSSLLLLPLGSIFFFVPIIKAKVPLNVWVDIVHSYFKMKHFFKSPLEVLCGVISIFRRGPGCFFGISADSIYRSFLLEWSASSERTLPVSSLEMISRLNNVLQPCDKQGQRSLTI